MCALIRRLRALVSEGIRAQIGIRTTQIPLPQVRGYFTAHALGQIVCSALECQIIDSSLSTFYRGNIALTSPLRASSS